MTTHIGAAQYTTNHVGSAYLLISNSLLRLLSDQVSMSQYTLYHTNMLGIYIISLAVLYHCRIDYVTVGVYCDIGYRRPSLRSFIIKLTIIKNGAVG